MEVAVAVDVCVAVSVIVCVTVAVCVAVNVGVTEAVTVLVGVTVEVAVSVAVDVCVYVGVFATQTGPHFPIAIPNGRLKPPSSFPACPILNNGDPEPLDTVIISFVPA